LSRIAAIESGAKDATATRNLTKGIDPATFKDEANQTTEDQIGLDKNKRRDVQRRLTGLGFDTKLTGLFDPPTRAVITRWQAARGYPQSGYLNKLQHKALLTEAVAAAPTASAEEDRPKRRTTSQQAQPQVQYQQAPPPPRQQYAPGPDPAGAGRFIGGVMGGMLR
jgi:peptidoglycan hydrolase-like protein with peptidoglycan-binding domain